jgi:cupin fold WbuC family metalloprotein
MDKRITAEQLDELALKAKSSSRGRAHLNTHDALDAAVQRLFIATTPGTYMRPHRHREAHKWEFFVLLEGSMDLLVFDDDGVLTERSHLSRSALRAIELSPGQWHSYVCCELGTLAIEVKQGEYLPTAEIDFAPWAPAENSDASRAYLEWMQTATVGAASPREPGTA